jgi:glycosyltransferase involved in cell wall biosynthesis
MRITVAICTWNLAKLLAENIISSFEVTNMADRTVSVIIPCYGQAHLLPFALESILNQSYPSIQIIVVNDGSKDNTDEVVMPYLTRITYVRQNNAGLPSARNAGIQVATGKYLYFLDADDLVHSDAIAWLVEAMEDREDRLVLMGACFFSDPAHPDRGRILMPLTEQRWESNWLFENLVPPNSYLCSKSMVMAVGCFDPSLKSCEDWDLWLRLVVAGARVSPVYQVGAYYRQYPGSMSTNKIRMAQTRIEVLSRASHALRIHPRLFQEWQLDCRDVRNRHRQILGEEHFGAAYLFRQSGDYVNAFRHYFLSLSNCYQMLNSLSGIAKLFPHYIRRHVLSAWSRS